MADITNKPLAHQAYELCIEIEKLPSSEQQTACSTLASALLEKLAALDDDGWNSERPAPANKTVQIKADACKTDDGSWTLLSIHEWRNLPKRQSVSFDGRAGPDDDGWGSWQHGAYVKLGHVRDDLPPEHVKIIQDFIGELPPPPEEGDD